MTDQNVRIHTFAPGEEEYTGIRVWAEGKPLPLYSARVSKYPINRRWPGYQRSKDQTELAPFAILATDGAFEMRVETEEEIRSVTVRPLAKNVTPQIGKGEVSFTLPGAGYYTVEINGHHKALHLFVDEGTEPVAVPDGDVIFFGPGQHDVGLIELKSGQTLFIDEGAVVYSRVVARDAEDIRIMGRGILDGSRNVETILRPVGEKELEERKRGFAVSNAHREHTVVLEYCRNVSIEGITLRDSLVYNIRPVCCVGLHIEGVRIIGNWRYNSDGIDMHNCRDVVIRNCFVRTYDDSICVKGFDYTQNEADMLHNGVLYDDFRNVLVEKCVIWCDWGRALEIGAETKAREICDITFRDCDVIRDVGGVACDVQNVDYADVHRVTFEDIRVEYDDVCQPPILQLSEEDSFEDVLQSDYMPNLMGVYVSYIEEYSGNGTKRGKNRDICFRNIRVTAPKMPCSYFVGYDVGSMCEDVTVDGLWLNGERITGLEEAKIRANEFCRNINLY